MITTLRFTPAWLATGLFVLAGCGDKTPKQAVAKETVPATPAVSVTPESAPEPTPTEPIDVTPATFEGADSAFREHRYADAVEGFTAYTARRPGNAWGFYMLGLSSWKAGDLPGAETAFHEALSLDSTHVKSYLNLSRVLLESGQPDSAQGYLETVLGIDDGLEQAYRLMGRVHEARGESDDAVTAYYRALALDSTDVWSMNNLGYLLIQEGAFEDALRPLALATERAPEVATFQNNLGVALELTGHYVLAANAYRAALSADSGFTKASVNLERVSALTEGADTPFIDLQTLAEEFRRQIAGSETGEVF